MFAFLNVATTNLYASAKAEKKEEKCESVVRTASKVSLFCGLGIMALLFKAGKPLLRLYMGSSAAESGLLAPATNYVHIRALTMTTSLWYGVIQASLLGAKDSLTPLVAIVCSSIVNIVGDVSLVKFMGKGVEGAAVATVLAQWIGTMAMLRAASTLAKGGLKNLFVKPKEMKTEDQVSSASFLKFAIPVLTLILGKLAAFGFMVSLLH